MPRPAAMADASFMGWPPCDVSGEPVDRRSGVLSINPPDPPRLVSLSVVEFEDLMATEPDIEKWLWSHARCSPDANVVWIEAERFDTLGKMFDHTLHLAEKLWYQATNWRETVLRFYDLPDA